MRNFAKRVLFFIFFIVVLITAAFFGFNLKTNPYKFAQYDQVIDTDGKYIISSDNVSISPAKIAGIQIGDKILEVDSQKLGANELIDYTESKGVKQYNFKVEREGKIYNFVLTPVQRYESEEIKFGFWARDDIAGIGTVTFIDPATGTYSAIGHGISDSVTGNLIDIESGTISKANITSIKSGKKGEPGEVIGYILNDESLGTVSDNTHFGIYGKINEDSMGYFSSDLMEIGKKEEIELGPAYIISCVNNEIKKYTIDISKIFYQNKPNEKSFVIRITDEELLEMTNGIIQGMSGSPIIQNNKIVGAVTHVFMNDPSKGYGIYIEWVFEEIKNSD